MSFCCLGRDAYGAGGLMTALLRGEGDEGFDKQRKVTIQAFGHIAVDTRWIKTRTSDGTSFFSQSFDESQGECSSPLPRAQSQSSSGPSVLVSKGPPLDDGDSSNIGSSQCIFTTQIVTIADAESANEGIFVQFDLPMDLLPTFKGLYLTINYFIQLSLFSPSTNIYTRFFFPFIVSGSGSSSSKPYSVRFSNINAIPFLSLPPDNCFCPLPDAAQDVEDDGVEGNSGPNRETCHPVTFNIRDEDLICSVCLLLPSTATASNPFIKLYAGNTFNICLDFLNSKQPCHTVKSRLILCEKRTDGTRVQDKVLIAVSRNTRDAISMNLQLHIPNGITCDFSCPILDVSHVLEVEFFAEAVDEKQLQNKEQSIEPQTWSIPVVILPQKKAVNAFAEFNACLEPVQVLRA